MIRGLGGLKRRVRGHVVTGEMKSCASLWRKSQVQNTSASDHFWKLRCRQLRAAVARSASASQNVQSTPCPARFLKLGCGQMARRCGAKQCQTTFGSLDVKKWHPIVVQSTFARQNVKNWRSRATFGRSDVEKLHAAVVWSTDLKSVRQFVS